MAQLQVRCPACKEIMGTGINVDSASFKTSTLVDNITCCDNLDCPVIDFKWSKEDVINADSL